MKRQITQLALLALLFTSFTSSLYGQPQDEVLGLGSREVDAIERDYRFTLRTAVSYLEKNPREIPNVMDPKLFNVAAKLIKEGSFEKLRELDLNPQVKGTRGELLRLQGEITGLSEFGKTLLDSEDEENIKSQYMTAYNLILPAQRRRFKTPEQVLKLKKDEAKKELNLLINWIGKLSLIPFKPTSPGWKWDCDDEIGQQRIGAGDSANRCVEADHDADGLFRNSNTANFPLKYYHTCIKSQGSRGTCVGFAITAIVESLLMLKEDKAYNLAEQYTYLYGEVYSDHGGRYTYGLNTGSALGKMDSKNIKFQYESFWEYNPSSSMGDKTGDIYPMSCTGYSGEMCTNFAFQSQETITGIWPFQNFTYTVPYRGTAKNIQIVDTGNIWFSWNKTASLDLAIALLKSKIPLVLSFNVRENFMDTGSDGYVYYQSGQDNVGGHASVLLGFIPNDKLPAGVTPASEKGFFILKNSWGTWNGDCGYYYMDYKYLRNFAKGIFTAKVN